MLLIKVGKGMIQNKIKDNINELSKKDMIVLIEKLKNKQEMQEKFILDIYHDLRSPLNVIMSVNQMLESIKKNNELYNTKETEYLKMLRRNSYKMLKLIDNLMDVTKLEKNHFEIKKKNIEIVRFIEGTIESIDKYAKQKNLTLIFDTNKEECIVAIDPEALDRICINLISNAIKFSESENFIYITLMIDNKLVKISFMDNGIGISKEDQKNIFNRFNQVNTNGEYKGSGIGLDLVKSLVELHGGSVSLESKLGYGSNFIITLPNEKIESEEIKFEEERNKVQLLEIEFSDIYL
ncbi:signal transduction histidine kinase [Eubacterium multiforme]|uniref:histidine kinase n=2 Tax=Eubacterium multiforme TaxID=83339 RepID=A0ABT9UY67_9FIRM|nr:signal transduction histidine kinase [Eubacterium multiforme]